MGLVAGGHHVEPLDGIGFVAGVEFVKPIGGFGELGEELGGDFGADFVAAAPNRRADGSEEVGGIGFELHLHLADGFDDDTGQSAAPSCVDGGNCAFFRVDQEDGHAVGGLDAEEQAGTVRCGSIARHGGQALANLGWCDIEKMDDVGMDLFQGDEFQIRSAEGRMEAAAVFEDVFLGVPFGETEIENSLGVLRAHAAWFGAEAVDEPGEFGERGNLKDSDATGLAFDPVLIGSGGRDRQECLSYRGTFAILAFGL